MANGVWITRYYPGGGWLEADSFDELKRMEAEVDALLEAHYAAIKYKYTNPWARIKTMLRRLIKC